MQKFCGIKVSSRFFLAPMAAITNLPFRLLCKEHGAGMAFTEMVNATHVARRPEIIETLAELKTCREEKPIALQLFGNKAEDFPKAAGLLEEKFEMINLNAGCPATDVTKIGAGAALLKEPEKIAQIVKLLKESCKKPVTVKIRLGWQKDNSAEICKVIEKAGADSIIVHARLAGQGYSGKADWSAVRFLQKSSGIPIVYNGDINGENAQEMLENTGCEFGMIGRCAMQNPLVFKEIGEREKGIEWKAGEREKLEAFGEYFKICKKFGMQDEARIKIAAMNFTKGIQGARKLRERIMKAKSTGQVMQEIKGFGESR